MDSSLNYFVTVLFVKGRVHCIVCKINLVISQIEIYKKLKAFLIIFKSSAYRLLIHNRNEVAIIKKNSNSFTLITFGFKTRCLARCAFMPAKATGGERNRPQKGRFCLRKSNKKI